ncbi:DNA helicase [Enterococcus florum]|uniref:DNA helicase n=1 Tax=Enterococcus florum TaxID=2480627 RepID=A0A4P5PAH5_9ENTE|nr:DEAD/DEAH box helicase [Enterococcus florum]GCF93414.1 DNA helicase [Enterococcus florum]
MEAYRGQRLLRSEWEKFYPSVDLSAAIKSAAVKSVNQSQEACQRCDNQSLVNVPAGFSYCPACLTLGRVTTKDDFYYFEPQQIKARRILCQWTGELSEAQKSIADQLVSDQDQGSQFLIWAVTGAGKTEILFPLIQKNLSKGRRVALTSPRVDVCNELYLRFTKAFPYEKIGLYHGQRRIDAGNQFIVCTVHQLFRYFQLFDLIILDEVDAFPYAGDPLLQRATLKALHPEGKLVYLSATPPKNVKQTVDRWYRLPARYHRRPLPVPRLMLLMSLDKQLRKAKLSVKLLKEIGRLLEKNDLLLFCPSIDLLEQVFKQLMKVYPDAAATTVYAKDDERLLKVENMREGKYRLLITTTILERGVTFEGVSVMILQASHPVFNKAALVQIAGRADRKGEYQQAEVVFAASERTRAIKAAIAEIRENNRLAEKAGLLDEVQQLS